MLAEPADKGCFVHPFQQTLPLDIGSPDSDVIWGVSYSLTGHLILASKRS